MGEKSDDDDVVTTSTRRHRQHPPAQAARAAAPAPPRRRWRPRPSQTTVAAAAPIPEADASAAAAYAPARAPRLRRAPAPAARPAAASDPNSPVGIWATEENKGNVRIEECGANLCGYSVNTGARILINMKPQGSKWTGRIHDHDSGRNYDSTIALKSTDYAQGQGCAFGGMFLRRPDQRRVS